MSYWNNIKNQYFDELLNNVMPFWVDNGFDTEEGGYMNFLGEDGTPLSTDKGGWVHGRLTWVLSTIYDKVEKDPKWLDLAEHAADFLKEKLQSGEGRIYFEVARDGSPLVLRRYLFAEVFAVIGYAMLYKVSSDKKWLDLALYTLDVIEKNQGKLPEKINSETRQFRGHSWTMILISMYQVLRDTDDSGSRNYDALIDVQISDIFKYFVKEDKKVLLETVSPDGTLSEGPEGRCFNPGHTIETVWFILEEAKRRGDKALLEKTLPLLDWTVEKGWDTEFGGLYSFLDSDGLQPVQVEWEMKYWWPHTEAIYAALLAYQLTGNEKYKGWFQMFHDYTWSHFPDRLHGEWYGYLRRDGSVSSTVKGNHYKGPFHIPRCLINVGLIADEIENGQWGGFH